MWSLGVAEYAEIVRRLGGQVSDRQVTYTAAGGRSARVNGGAGLSMRLGVLPAELLSDIRMIASVCMGEQPHPALEFVDNIRPVTDLPTLQALAAGFDSLLASDSCAASAVPVVPTRFLGQATQARGFSVRIGTAPVRFSSELSAEDILRHTRCQEPGRWVDVLSRGEIRMFADRDGRELIGSARATKWLEVGLAPGPRRFFLVDGDWYEIDEGYLATHRATVDRLLKKPCTLDLPSWSPGWREGDYNEWVPSVRRDYVCLDRQLTRTQLHHRGGVEICDLLGPENELIMVKRAHGSAPLSHLFSQGLVSVPTLLNSPDARLKFASLVRERGNGRVLEPDFVPRKVVFAILLKDGEPLTSDTLFPFSQVTLAFAARALQAQGVDVEVRQIGSMPDRPEDRPQSRALIGTTVG